MQFEGRPLPEGVERAIQILQEHCGKNFVVIAEGKEGTWTYAPFPTYALGACHSLIGDIEHNWEVERHKHDEYEEDGNEG